MSVRASASLPSSCSGRHVLDGAEDRAGLGQRRLGRERRQRAVAGAGPAAFASPKSRSFTPDGVSMMFAGLQIAVDDALAVRRGECVRDLRAVPQRLFRRRAPFASRSASVSPFQELHHEVIDVRPAGPTS